MAGQDKWYFTKEQLLNSPSRKCGLDADKELAYRQQAANLIQDMGQRLHVSQLCINTAIVYMHRFYAFHSFTHFHRNAMAAAALFLAAKMEEQPRKLEYIIKIAHHCLHRDCMHSLDARSEYYQEQAQDLVFNENVLLQTLGFDVAIDHPHTHVVKTCSLIRASKDLAQTSYFMASNSLHLTTMCLQYKPTVVACFCIHLASKWSNWEIPQSNEGKHWFNYVDKSVTAELLEHLTSEFLHIFDRCPSRLKKKIMSMPNSQGSPSQLGGSSHNSGYVVASSPFDKEPRKIKAEPEDARKYSKPENDEFRKIKLENDDSRKYPKNESDEMRKNKQEMEDMRKNLKQEIEEKVELSKHQRGLFSPPTASSTVTKIDHREYRERQKRAAAALAAGGGSSSSGGTNAMPPSTSGSLPRPPHNRWPHPPRDSEVKEREIPNVPHPSLRDPSMNRESSRDSGMSMLREPTNVRDPNMRESMSSRDHNGMRETSREASNVRDMSGAYRDMSNPRERDSSNHREHIPQRDSLGQRDINSSHNLHATSENLRSTADRNMNMGNLNRDPNMSGANVRDSNSLKESMARDNTRDHSNISGQSTGRDPSGLMREMPVMGQPGSSNRPVSGHSSSRESGANRLPSGPPANGGASLNQQQRSSHSSSTNSSRHIPSTQGIPQDSRQKSSQQNYPPRPAPVLPTPPAHPIPSQRPQSLFSPPEPQRKPSRPSQPSLMTIPREAFVPAPLSPFSSPTETEIKGPPEVVENIVAKKEEVVVVPPITQSAVPPPSLAESEISNNLETDPNLVSCLLKEAIPYRTEKKKKKEKHKHKDKKDKRDKHKKNKDKKRDSDEHSSGSNSINNTNPSTQPIVSNSNNLSIKITLPREAAANILPPVMPAAIGSNGGSTTGGHPVGSGNAISNNNTASLDDYTSPPARRLTIKIPREKIKLQPPSPPPQQTASSRQTQALKIKIPKELVERESRKRPMEQGGSREGPPTKASKNQPNMHHSSNKISHHAMGNGQSNYK